MRRCGCVCNKPLASSGQHTPTLWEPHPQKVLEAGQNPKGPRGLPDILKGMKIFSLVSGCKIAWQEPRTEHRMGTRVMGQGQGRQRERTGLQEDSDHQWLLSCLLAGQSFLTFQGKKKTNNGPQTARLLTNAQG